MESSARTTVERQVLLAGPERREPEGVIKTSRPAMVFRACVFAACLVAIYFAFGQGVAAWYFHGGAPQQVESAARWDPGNPQYADRLANLMHFYSENPDPKRIVELCEKATELSPNDAHYWVDLGSAYDWAGQTQDATRAFERAHALFPNSPEIDWRLANFYIRAKRRDEALPLLKEVLVSGGVDDRQVFALLSHTGIESHEVMANVLPPSRTAFVDYLNFQLSLGNIGAAGRVWAGMLASGVVFEPADAFGYIDALLRDRNVDAAAQIWQKLADRFPPQAGPRNAAPNLVTNSEFEFPILNGGFDWRVTPVEGVTVKVNPATGAARAGSLEINFDGSRNFDYDDVFEFVVVRPNTRYKFSAELRTEGITTDSGTRFQIFDDYAPQKLFVSTKSTTGNTDWVEQTLVFQTGPDTQLLVVRVARPKSDKFDNKISGTVLIRQVSLLPENSQ